MNKLVVDVLDDGMVEVSAVPGESEAFREAAAGLVAAGEVSTVTGPRGVALRVSREVAEKAGVVKTASRRGRPRKQNNSSGEE